MQERDRVRKKIGKSNESEWKELQGEYKRIRNEVTKRIRQDTIIFNEERINKAGDENELWKVVNDITKPRSETSWKLEEDGREVEKEEEIADIFNNYFIEKIDKLKKT